MIGDNTLWLPGTDHAGIATQMVVARQLKEEGVNYRDLGREKFEERVWQWKAQSGDTIKRQMVRLGASCDWSRERFTLDPGLARAVREAFVSLYEKGLLYRGEYMVNWCPHCHTALSDLEVAHADVAGHLWHIRYPVNGLPGRFLTVATTRPETMLGDTAVAINAKDPRYLDLHGKTVQLPLMDREIPIILDDLADPEFGTGVVKVTPAHDLNDFEAGKRHNLPKIKVIDENAMMTGAAGPYANLDRFVARKSVVADLEKIGALVKIEDYQLSLGKCDRCKTAVEPLISTQWFVKTKPLAEKAIAVVESGEIGFVPANWTKTYYEWMYNIRDWCVSRQLWWGHRIPAWHCGECKEIVVARETPIACPRCASLNLTQDTDVLDTWFSSGLWPFSTLGWPDKTADLAKYYPTSLLITGFDILFFWVARMVMMGCEFMGEIPFKQVYIHGLVRDADRQKMSKTKGNVIDPLVVTEKYGTDAVRMALLQGAAPGTDIVLTEERMESSRAFANKIWNAARFLFMNADASATARSEPTIEDRWIKWRLNAVAKAANRAIEQYRYHELAQILWHFFWHEFCDWYLELKKVSGTGWGNAIEYFETSLCLLHPAMPFLTEELWQRLDLPAGHAKSIALAPYPQFDPTPADPETEKAVKEIEFLQPIVTDARRIRTERGVAHKKRLDGTLKMATQELVSTATGHNVILGKLTNVELTIELRTEDSVGPVDRDALSSPFTKAVGDITPTHGVVKTRDYTLELRFDVELTATQQEAQRSRLAKKRQDLEKNIANRERQLSDEASLAKTPPKVVEDMRAKLAKDKADLATLS
jgi:valyl-tRNA synthetase